MEIRERLARLPIFPLLIAVSCLVGWFIPAFYDWTGTDQSRLSPWIGPTALGMIVGYIIVCVVLPWLPIDSYARDTDLQVRVRFTIRNMLALTAASAVVIAALMEFPRAVSGLLCTIAFCVLVRFWILHRHDRWQTAALLACMYLPFIWLITYDELDNMVPTILWMAAGLPAFLPAGLVGSWVGRNSHNVRWLPMLLTGAEMIIGVWMIRLGPRRTIAYLVFLLLISTFGSFGLNALVRA